MEMPIFFAPVADAGKYEDEEDRWNWYLEYGMGEFDIRWYKHEKLAHYASRGLRYRIQF